MLLSNGCRGSRSLISGFLLLIAGCYSYSGAALESVRVGQGVRARISGSEAERLEPVLGNSDRTVEGQLLEKGDSAVVVSVATPLSTEANAAVSQAVQRIEIPRADLEQIEVRHIDRFRTSVLVLGGIAGAAAAVAAVSQVVQLGGGGSRSNPNKTRVPTGIPLLLVRLSR